MDINNINHVGMAVRDLAETTAPYEAMGFQLTPYSPHSGGLEARRAGPAARLGQPLRDVREHLSGDPRERRPKKPAARIVNFLKRHQGAHIVCFLDCGDCDLRRQNASAARLRDLRRDPAPARDRHAGRRAYREIRALSVSLPKDSPEGYIQCTTHLTPEYIYQPRYIAHANGCFRLAEAIMVTDDLPGFAKRYEAYIGAAPSREDGAVKFHLPLGTTTDADRCRDAAAMLPGTLLPPIPGIAAVVFRTRARWRASRTELAG